MIKYLVTKSNTQTYNFCIDELRDNNQDTFWQSDNAQPHFINIEFQKKMKIRAVSFYIDFKTDESYTPSKIAIKVGNRYDFVILHSS